MPMIAMVSRRSLVAAALGLSLVAPAAGETVTVTDITREAGENATITVPTVELTDASIGEDEVRALFAADHIVNVGAILTRLVARSVVIPEIRIEGGAVEADGNDTRGTVTLTNLRLGDVAQGIAGEFSIESGTLELMNGVAVSVGGLALSDLNMGYLFTLAGAAGEIEAFDPRELESVWSSLTIGASSFSSEDGSCSVTGFEGGALAIREPEHTSIPALFELMEQAEETREEAMAATGDERAEKMKQVADEAARLQMHYYDVFTSYAAGPASLSGLDCDVTTENGDPVGFAIAGVTFGEASPGTFADITASGLAIENTGSEAGTMSIDSMHILPGDYAKVAALFAEIGLGADGDWMEANQRQLIPSFGGFEFGRITMDMPNTGGTAAPGARIVGSVGSFAAIFDSYLNGIPTSVSSSATDVTFELPRDQTGEMLAALGLDPLSVSYDVSAKWNRARQEIVVDNLVVSAANGGTITLSAVIGNARPQLFSLDQSAAARASQAITIKELSIDVSDAGLLDKGLAVMAAQQNVEPAQFRTAMATMAQGIVLLGLGGTPESIEVAGAINRFLSTGGELSLTATALSPAGVSIAEMQQRGDPSQILKLFSITVGETAAAEEPAGDDQAAGPAAAPPSDGESSTAVPAKEK